VLSFKEDLCTTWKDTNLPVSVVTEFLVLSLSPECSRIHSGSWQSDNECSQGSNGVRW
jgi:hypothetical protein